MEKEVRAREAEELIQKIRNGIINSGFRIQNSEAGISDYAEVREKLLGMELEEVDFSSEVLFRWYETIRKVPAEDFSARAGVRMTVSMTSWPGRIAFAAEALKGIYAQGKKADRVLLWLAEEQFPGKEADLPEALLEQVRDSLAEIRWCEDLKSHKKYFFALQENTDGVTVTVDDDLVYVPEMLELLYLSWLRHPDAVSAMRTHYMAVSDEGQILPYAYWVKETDARIDEPEALLFATTGAGTLYPAGIIGKEWFDRDAIRETCLMADDLWMKAAEAMQGTPVVQACRSRGLKYVPGSQGETLWEQNREGNDAQLRKIQDWIAGKHGAGTLEKKLTASRESGIAEYSLYACGEIDKQKQKLKQTYGEKSELIRENAALKKENTSVNKQLRETQAKLDAAQGELEQIHGTMTYKLWRKLIRPARNLIRKQPG